MHKLRRHALVTALSAITVATLLATGCSTESPATGDRAAATTAETPEPAAAGEQLAVVAAPPDGATPTAMADARADDRGEARKSPLKVASYDRKSGRAVITAPPSDADDEPSRPDDEPSATPSRTGTPTPTAPDEPDTPSGTPSDKGSGAAKPKAAVAVGDVIASAPAPGAPDGVLAEVTEIVDTAKDGGTTVATEPATLDAVLGEREAKGAVPVDPSTLKVDPLVQGVKVSWAKTGDLTFGPEGAKLPLGSLRIDVGAAVETAPGAPASAAASVEGFVQLAPEVAFSYDGSGSGTGSSPGGAFLGLTGDWASQWSLKGRAAGSTDGKPIRIPFAELHADPVIQAGPVPIVVNLDLVCYFEVTADGRVTVDVEQDLKGDFKVGGNFTWSKGWQGVSESHMTGEPLKTTVTAVGDVKAAMGAEATVGLYGTVGVTADVAPYLRAEADATAEGSADGTGSASGSWALYGGIDLTGTLNIQLSIFGTPIFQTKIPLGAVHEEWLLTKGEAKT
ncbi:hypothetical protein F3K40_10950 [Streptomyces sp. LBUM 1478]|uniref:Putative lipoprotein n=6 Tax=Streptomyces scabiei TaxID=1930 RepID=C9Z2K9_STRSW|nr:MULTISPECIES: hypothetical protein [Streptomyces]MBP5867559.1 hypothetical protein [Streptomyces sp. LBUM 1485]MBP5906163.1 hypothetical protein [Streptomyces sp. LBUM 1478]MBP5931250.1 hypothetical protein [Streptomyces sp. LBUM 1479]MBP5916629.1 hypothetical protein [Streptomyces sp. LBUM 1486]MDW8473297.1 hypothetical protein [Streptomyces scabiei]